MDARKIGLKIKRYRNKKGLSFTELKQATDINIVDLQAYEEEKQEPSKRELQKIAVALGVDITDLLP